MQKKILITFLFKEGAGPVFTLEMARGLAPTERIGKMRNHSKV